MNPLVYMVPFIYEVVYPTHKHYVQQHSMDT